MREVTVDAYKTKLRFEDDATDEFIAGVVADRFPDTPENIVTKLDDPNTYYGDISQREYDIYRKYNKTWEWKGAAQHTAEAGEALGSVLGEMWDGAKAVWKEAPKDDANKRIAASLAEGAVRGTRELVQMGMKGLNHLANGLMDEEQEDATGSYDRFLYLKANDNVIAAATSGDMNMLEGLVNDEYINNDIANGAKNILDPTLVVGLPGTKLIGKVSQGMGSVLEGAGKATSKLGRGLGEARDGLKKGLGKAKESADKVVPGLGSWAAGASGVTAATTLPLLPAIGAIAIPELLEISGNTISGIGRAWKNSPTRKGAMRGLATDRPGTPSGWLASRLTALDGPIDLVGSMASGTVSGGVFGAALGFASDGTSGAAGGLGSGMSLGGGGNLIGRGYQRLSGSARKAAITADFDRFVADEANDPELTAWARKVATTVESKAHIMDSMNIVLKGTDVAFHGKNQEWFTKKGFGQTAGAEVTEGGKPTIYINTDIADPITFLHESVHALGKLDGPGDYINDVKREFKEAFPEETEAILSKYRSKLEASMDITTPEGVARMEQYDAKGEDAKVEEIAAEYFAAFIKGEDANFLFDGTRSRVPGVTTALNIVDHFANRAAAKQVERVVGLVERNLHSELLGDIPRSKQIDRFYREMVKARRKAYEATAIQADAEFKAYTAKDLGNDETFEMLKEQGLATDKNGKREFASKAHTAKINKETALNAIDVLKELKDKPSKDKPSKDKPSKDKPASDDGLVELEDGSWGGKFFSPAQLDALDASGKFPSRTIEKWRSIREAIDGGNVVNITYNAAWIKKRGKKRAGEPGWTSVSRGSSRIPTSNRDGLPYSTRISAVGQINVQMLDWSKLRHKAAEAHARHNSNESKLWETLGDLEVDLARYLEALVEGTKPTAEIFGAKKRDQLNKLVEARNTKGNPQLPEGSRLTDGNNIWKDFRLDRIEAMQTRSESVRFAQEAYVNAQNNFSPAEAQAKFSPPAPDTPEFRSWFGGSKVVKDNGQPKPLFHGTARPDRVGSRFQKSKATSGPMSFFTDDPKIASNYATGKRDTSLDESKPLVEYFKKGKQGLSEVWSNLSPDARQKVRDLSKRIGQNDDTGAPELKPPGQGLVDSRHWSFIMRDNNWNPLNTLAELWLESGAIFGEEASFTKVLRLAGVDGVKYDDPHANYSGVYPVFMSLKSPLDTSSVPAEVITSLEKASTRVRKPKVEYGADSWDKNSRYSAEEWISQLKEDNGKGKNSMVWTSIPDWVTKVLKQEGFDGIADTGGKMEYGAVHNVYIPFEPSQIKSATANKGGFNPDSPDIRFSPAEEAAYIDAVNGKDTSTAQKMVDEAAKRAGYKSAAYHGSPDLRPLNKDNVYKSGQEQYLEKKSPDDAYFFTTHKAVAQSYANKPAWDYQGAEPGIKNVYLDLGNSKIIDGKGEKWKYRTQQSVKEAKAEGFDSYTVNNTRDTYNPGKVKGTVYAVFKPSQIKSADSATYDDGGNLVPLSERFSKRTDDVRFSPEGEFNDGPVNDDAGKVLSKVPLPDFKVNVKPLNDLRKWLDSSKSKLVKDSSSFTRGKEARLRIDIPTFRRSVANGDPVYAISVHDKGVGDRVGKVQGYTNIAGVKDAQFVVNQPGAEGIKSGKTNKWPIAYVKGEYKPITSIPDDIGSWTQAGMNPRRHSYFYDRATGDPIISGDEAISHGATVFVKNPVFGDKSDFRFSPGVDRPAPELVDLPQASTEFDHLRVGTAKLGTKTKYVETPQGSNVGGHIVGDTVLESHMESMNYEQVPADIKKIKDPAKKRHKYIRWLSDNILALHDAFQADLRQRATMWYDGANKIAREFGTRFSYKAEQAAAVIAVLSPQKDWFMNVSQAEQVMDIWTNHQNTVLSEAMTRHEVEGIIKAAKAADGKLKKKPKGVYESPEQKLKREAYNKNQHAKARTERRKILEPIMGQSIDSLKGDTKEHRTRQGWAIRILAQVGHGREYSVISPEGQAMQTQTKGGGKAQQSTWSGVDTILKAVSVMQDGSLRNISDQLGEKHKVRNFYNNIIAPNSPHGDATIDTHAVAAGHLMPLGSSATEVNHNFGSVMTEMVDAPGAKGSYHVYMDAYRMAAAARGLLPRQMQSITWEAVRLLYGPKTKMKGNTTRPDTLKKWKNKNHEEARTEIVGGGLPAPAWARSGPPGGPGAESGSIQGDGGQVDAGGGLRFRGGGPDAARRKRVGGVSFSPGRSLNKRGGMLYTTEAGHKAIKLSDRSGIKVYDPNGKRIGKQFDDIDEANEELRKASTSSVRSRTR